MTSRILAISKKIRLKTALSEARHGEAHLLGRCLVFLLILSLCFVEGSREIVLGVLSDAYWQVASYVALTLFIFYALQARLSEASRLADLLRRSSRHQIVFAALMGVLPGCGGAIVVITQFVKGRLCFGSVVAVLTATMGDAAFLLLATSPSAGIQVLSSCFLAGCLSGMVVDRAHEEGYLRPEPAELVCNFGDEGLRRLDKQGLFWMIVLVPTMCVALLGSFQVDLDSFFGVGAGTFVWLGSFLAMTGLLFWVLGSKDDSCNCAPEDSEERHIFSRVAQETNQVSTWVICGFLLFEFMVLAFGLDFVALFSGIPAIAILVAVMVGWIPGCGPQIIMTTLFLNGAMPFSAQLGNAISNDGDALFPALALAPKAALAATFYSTIPALLMAYGHMFFFE